MALPCRPPTRPLASTLPWESRPSSALPDRRVTSVPTAAASRPAHRPHHRPTRQCCHRHRVRPAASGPIGVGCRGRDPRRKVHLTCGGSLGSRAAASGRRHACPDALSIAALYQRIDHAFGAQSPAKYGCRGRCGRSTSAREAIASIDLVDPVGAETAHRRFSRWCAGHEMEHDPSRRSTNWASSSTPVWSSGQRRGQLYKPRGEHQLHILGTGYRGPVGQGGGRTRPVDQGIGGRRPLRSEPALSVPASAAGRPGGQPRDKGLP